MSKTFTVNGKEYRAKAFDFNLVCDLEDMGIDVFKANKKPIATARAYFALCVGEDKEYAGKEMEEHLIKGGSLNDVINAMMEEMDSSDFFRNLAKKEEQETTENTSKKK